MKKNLLTLLYFIRVKLVKELRIYPDYNMVKFIYYNLSLQRLKFGSCQESYFPYKQDSPEELHHFLKCINQVYYKHYFPEVTTFYV